MGEVVIRVGWRKLSETGGADLYIDLSSIGVKFEAKKGHVNRLIGWCEAAH